MPVEPQDWGVDLGDLSIPEHWLAVEPDLLQLARQEHLALAEDSAVQVEWFLVPLALLRVHLGTRS